jgi:hypothetical protein
VNTPAKYRAFLSYSRHDELWGKRLASELKRYRTSRYLSGRETAFGPVPKTVQPIFCDCDQYPTRRALSHDVNGALENAEFFAVVCSPYSARSDYINEEVRRFMILRGRERVIPILKDGEPQHHERECFPPALWMGPSGERQEPIYIDARPTAGKKQIILRKIVATLVGLTPEDLQNSARQERQYRRRVAAGTLVFMAATAALAIAFYERELLLSAWQEARGP